MHYAYCPLHDDPRAILSLFGRLRGALCTVPLSMLSKHAHTNAQKSPSHNADTTDYICSCCCCHFTATSALGSCLLGAHANALDAAIAACRDRYEHSSLGALAVFNSDGTRTAVVSPAAHFATTVAIHTLGESLAFGVHGPVREPSCIFFARLNIHALFVPLLSSLGCAI